MDALKELQVVVERAREINEKRVGVISERHEARLLLVGNLAIAQQLSRIADAAERVAGVVVYDEKRSCSYFRVKRYSR